MRSEAEDIRGACTLGEPPVLVSGIGAVEGETGIPRQTLRMWERRYGFPRPTRSTSGDRLYSDAEIVKLRLLRRLIDRGHRPGKIVARSIEELRLLLTSEAETPGAPVSDPVVVRALQFLKECRDLDFRRCLLEALMHLGGRSFVLDVLRPLCHEVGACWAQGEIKVYQERLFTKEATRLLGQLLCMPFPGEGAPRVLLATLPGERHCLGLLALEALLTIQGAACYPLGTELPAEEIVECAVKHRIDVIALSFSDHCTPKPVKQNLEALRSRLPANLSLWAGGAAVRRVTGRIQGILLLPELEDGLRALEAWRAASPASSRTDGRTA